jgi:xanthine/uracil permease
MARNNLHPSQRLIYLLLGTSLVCSFLEIGLSFVPVKTLQRVFPPIVTGEFGLRFVHDFAEVFATQVRLSL